MVDVLQAPGIVDIGFEPEFNLPRAIADVLLPDENEHGLVRYKCLYGGRGAGKSWGIAQYIIIRALKCKTRIVCARETWTSIDESVHKLLVDTIERLELFDSFTITNDSILARNGSEIFHAGLCRNVHNLKSLEGCDVCWVEEAENIAAEAWEKLRPTIRNEASQIIISFNTRYADDPTYELFVTKQPLNCITRKINYPDNLYFPKVLQLEMEADKARDPDLYAHVWLGEPLLTGSRIWPDFDKLIHVKHWDLKELKDKANFFMSIDPHSAYYPAIIWGAVWPKPGARSWPEDYYKYIYSEWPTREDVGGDYCDLRKKLYFSGDLKDLAKVIYTKDGTAEFGITIKKRFVDTRYAKAAGGVNWTTSTQGLISTWAKREHGGIVLTQPAESTMSAIKSTIATEFRYNKLMPVACWNEPTIYIDPSCANLIQSLTNHRCVEGKEVEDEKYKDFSDALRILYAGMTYYPYKDPKIKGANIKYHRAPARKGEDSWMGA